MCFFLGVRVAPYSGLFNECFYRGLNLHHGNIIKSTTEDSPTEYLPEARYYFLWCSKLFRDAWLLFGVGRRGRIIPRCLENRQFQLQLQVFQHS
jgi:hypothetical protein